MTNSIICKLISNDFKINKVAILMWLVAAVIGILIAFFIPGLLAANIGFSLILSSVLGLGIHMMMHTVIFDKVKGTQIFIMSLPVTFRQHTTAKLLVNLVAFYIMWALLAFACLYIPFSQSLFPMGNLPMMAMVLFSILPAYSLMLSVCISSQSVGYTVIATISSVIGTSAYLWAVVYTEPIGNFVWGNEAVWNNTVYGIVIAQILLGIIIPLLTVLMKFKKKDFI